MWATVPGMGGLYSALRCQPTDACFSCFGGTQVGPRKQRELAKLVFYLLTFILAIYK